jgi:hypothetical protein
MELPSFLKDYADPPMRERMQEIPVPRTAGWKSYANASTSEIGRRGFCGQLASVG